MTNPDPNSRQVGGSHYTTRGLAVQHWDVAAPCFSLVYAASKYCDRFQQKGQKESLEKAIHYLEKTIELWDKGVHHGVPAHHAEANPYVESLGYCKALSDAIYTMLTGSTTTDMRLAILGIQSAIKFYYP